MANNDKCCPPPKEVQDFLFKQANISQVCQEFQNVLKNSSLIAADGKRGLLYLGHESKLIVLKPEADSSPEWKFDLNVEGPMYQIVLNCDCSLLAVTLNKSIALIYDTSSIHKHKLTLFHKIRLSANGDEAITYDIKWNPAIPLMLCSVTSDHTISCFQVSKTKNVGVEVIGMERAPGLEALCVSWSPKGKQIVVGCKNGDIIQLKPELKLARHLSAPNPSKGMIISILWVSNYQFCACYYNSLEQSVNVMIVDAPKGVTVPIFTNYEDITFGSGFIENICYYLELIPEWGIIIAGSSHSSEVAVLGTCDNGRSWDLWQLMDDSTAQLPLNRKKKIENYPVGMAIDKSATQKLPWGAESTLPNPVPILRILVTSGQMCSYHMVNLKQNAAVICKPPTKCIPAPELPRPSIGPSEVSFNLSNGATSTPRTKAIIAESQTDKPKPPTNAFGGSSKPVFSFLAPSNLSQIAPLPEVQNIPLPQAAEMKTNKAPVQGETKTNILQQDKDSKAVVAPQPEEVIGKSKQMPHTTNPQAEGKVMGTLPKLDTKAEFKSGPTSSTSSQAEPKSAKELPKDPVQQHPDTSKPKEMPVYDDGVFLRAYYEEQARFEKEIKGRLDLPSWNCGTEDERKLLVKKSGEIDDFLKELWESTNSLSSDIAYLKALLLQSFAWVEETKSRNMSSSSGRSRTYAESNKLADLQRIYYYTKSQLVQATKILDLEWAEHNDRVVSRMKIPSSEMIYQSLIRYTQIIEQQKKTLDMLSKKFRSIGRKHGTVASIDQSLTDLSISKNPVITSNDTAMNLRCKLIASNTRNMSQEKQMRLQDLLAESAPAIIRPIRPTSVQDRLEATLSSLASMKTAETIQKTPKAVKTPTSKLFNQQSTFSSLNNLVSGVSSSSSSNSNSNSNSSNSSSSAQNKWPGSVTTTLSSTSTKSKSKEAAQHVHTPVKSSSKENPLKGSVLTSAASTVPATNKFSGFVVPKPTSTKLDSIPIKFSMKPSEQQQQHQQQHQQHQQHQQEQQQQQQQQQQTPTSTDGLLDFSSLGFDIRPNTTSSLFGKPPVVTAAKVSASPATAVTASSAHASAPLLAATTPANSSLSFGSIAPALSFKLPSAVTISSPKTTTTPSTTTSPLVISFDSPASTAPFTTSSFSGILDSTASAAPSITPAFSNIFASTSSSTPAFGKSEGGSSIFGIAAAAATGSGSQSFGGLTASSNANDNQFVVSTTAAMGSNFGDNSSSSGGGGGGGGGGGSANTTTAATTTTISTSTTTISTSTTATSSTTATTATTTATATATTSSITGLVNLMSNYGMTSMTTPKSTVFEVSNGGALSSGSPVFAGAGITSQSSGNPVFAGTGFTSQSSGSIVFGGASTGQAPTKSLFGGTSTADQKPGGSVFEISTSQGAGSSVFGVGTTTPSTSSSVFWTNSTSQGGGLATTIFGAGTTTQGSTSSTSIFGSSATSTSATTSLFGGGSATTQSNASPLVFGSGSSVFGGSSGPSQQSAGASGTTSIFGAGAAAQGAASGGSVFGSSGGDSFFSGSTIFGGTSAAGITTTQSSNGVGAASTSSIFGGSSGAPLSSGTTTTAETTAATTSPTSVFAAGNPLFKPATVTATTSATAMFGGSSATGSIFNSGSSAPGSSVFNMAGTAATPSPSSSIFGSAAAQPRGSGLFGMSATANSSGTASNSIFGAPSTMGTSLFGGTALTPGGPAVDSGSVFGQSSTFGTKPTFVGPGTGAFGTGFPSQTTFGASTAPVFGSPSLLGAGSPVAGTSPNKVFGSGTFEALRDQSGGLSFDSLAQKTPSTEKPQAFKGSSSFSSWR